MRFLITIARMYPGRSALTLVSLLFASVAEGLSLLLLLPSLNLLTSDTTHDSGNGLSGVGHMLTEALSAIGVTPTVGSLLIVIVGKAAAIEPQIADKGIAYEKIGFKEPISAAASAAAKAAKK